MDPPNLQSAKAIQDISEIFKRNPEAVKTLDSVFELQIQSDNPTEPTSYFYIDMKTSKGSVERRTQPSTTAQCIFTCFDRTYSLIASGLLTVYSAFIRKELSLSGNGRTIMMVRKLAFLESLRDISPSVPPLSVPPDSLPAASSSRARL